MILIILIMFIILCIGYCYLFYKILEIEKDIECLYDNYSDEMSRITQVNLDLEKELKENGRDCLGNIKRSF